ncbi:triacylglycerol lipase OBL1-like [Malania oleifera]|uniref:triacylglycerol lipase OBL1-like n=1 Tax=Malania oleifera TaxID=397392 RepID=UPI0025AE4D0B|nr:triacylglycerol lipase OBL1-like [Malania oleifera]
MHMACNKSFCSDYILLKPEEVTLFDLLAILFYRKLDGRRFVECPEGKEFDFERRWLIFMSVVAQAILQLVKKPMAWMGSFVELWLNLLPTNGGLRGFMLNLTRGKLVIPKKESAEFMSAIGYVDERVGLDRNIKQDDRRYNGALSIMASKLAYENEACIKSIVTNHWKMEFLGFYDFWNDYQDKCTTQAFLLHDKDTKTIVVSFRGTEPFDADAWCTDADISWYELPGVGRIHGGFMKALGLQKNKGWPKEIEENNGTAYGHPPPAYYAIRNMLRELLQTNEDTKFIATGHSLGAALAILFPAILAMHGEVWMLERLDGVYTFGQPRVGDGEFGKFMKKQLKEHKIRYLRYVYCNDMVPRLPMDNAALMFKHFGPCLFYNSLYQGKVIREEPNKNYFSLSAAIPMFLNAVWELVRGFILLYIWGPSYKEGWFLKSYRVFGLVVPGLSAHAPQDYDNITRVGQVLEPTH